MVLMKWHCLAVTLTYYTEAGDLMNIIDSGYVYENTQNEYILKAEREVYLSSLLQLDYEVLYRYFKGSTVIPVFRIFVLTDSEYIDYEISKDVISASMQITYQTGQRRTLNITLANDNNKYRYGARQNLYEGLKFRLDFGVVIDSVVYWQQEGVFVLQTPSPTSDKSNKTISLTLADKWSLWDGTVYGKTRFKTIIPTQVPMREAFNTIIHGDNGLGQMWDSKPIRFNSAYWNTLTFYTIKQDAGQTISEPLLNMGTTISSDCYYDTYGNLNVESNVWDFINDNVPIVWRFDNESADCSEPQITFKGVKEYYNEIKTKGAIVNGYQFVGTAVNKNRKSPYNIYDYPLITKINDNSKLYSDNLCDEQSRYEMVQQSRGLRNITINCVPLPFLDVNQGVLLNFPDLGINNEIYIIDNISYNIGSNSQMSLSLTSSADVVF